MKKITIYLMNLIMGCFLSVSYAQNAPTEADHNELRALLTKSAQAMNNNDFDALRPYLDNNFTVITLDNNKFSNVNEFKTYWDKMLKGDKAKLKSVSIKPVADDKTYFPSDNVGVVNGTSEETYHFSDGDVRTMHTRWSAVVHKDNNQWKIMNIHFSGNILDNPVLDALKENLYKVAGASALAGLILGLLLMRLFCRSKAA